jgi:hypothetical protein
VGEIDSLGEIVKHLRALRLLREKRNLGVSTGGTGDERGVELARHQANSDLPAIAAPLPAEQHLITPLGVFGAPQDWEPMDQVALESWRRATRPEVEGALIKPNRGSMLNPTRPGPPLGLIDITRSVIWPEDPRDFLRLATDLKGEIIGSCQRAGLRIDDGPKAILVGGRPAVWYYLTGPPQAGGVVSNAHADVLVGNQLVIIELTAASEHFVDCLAAFWTVIGTAHFTM